MATTEVGIKIGLQGAQQVQSGLAGVGASLGQLGEKAGALRASLAAFGPQLAAAFTIGGIASFVQQTAAAIDALNDVSDATGASIEEISKLDRVARQNGQSLDTVSAALVKFNAVLKEAKPGSAIELALKSIGLEASKLRDLDPAVALTETAKALAGFADDGNKARLVQELFGKSLREVAPLLKDLAEAGQINATVTERQAAEAEKFNKALAQLKANATDASRAFVSDLIPAVTTYLEKVGFLQKNGLGSVRFQSDAVDQSKRLADLVADLEKVQAVIDNPATSDRLRKRRLEQAKELRAEIDKLTLSAAAANEKLKAALGTEKVSEETGPKTSVGPLPDEQALKEAQRLIDQITGSISKRADAVTLELEVGRALTESEKFRLEVSRQIQEATDKIGKAKAEQLRAELDGTVKLVESAEARRRATQADVKLFQQQQEIQGEIDADRIKGDESYKTRVLAQAELERSAGNQVELTRLEAQLLFESAETRARAIEQLKAQQAIEAKRLELNRDLNLTEERRAELLAKFSTTIQAGVEDGVQRALFDDARRTFDQVSQSLADALLSGGKKAGEALKAYFKTLILQPVIRAIVNPVAGAITSSLGFGSTAAQAAQGGGSSLSSLGSLASIGSFAGAVGSAFAGGFSATLAGGFASTTLAIEGGLAAIAAGTASSISVGLANIAGALGPYALAAAALVALYQALDKSGTPTRGADVFSAGTTVADPLAGVVTSRFGTDAAFQDNRVGATEQFLAPLALSSAQALNKLSALTGGVQRFAVGLQFATDGVEDTRGAIKLFADGVAISAKEELKFTKDLQQATKEFAGELALSLVGAIQETITLPKQLADELENLRTQVGGPSIEAIAEAFKLLPGAFGKIATLTDELRISLADLFGGFQQANAALGQYYEAFFTESERAQFASNQLTATLKSLGIDTVPATREAFRQLVDAQDLTTESGRGTFAALIALSGAFASITPAIESTAISVEQLVGSAEAALRRAFDAEAATLNEQIRAASVARQAYVDGLRREIDGITGLEQALRDAFGRDSGVIQESINGLAALSDSLQDFIDGLDQTIGEANIGTLAFRRQQFNDLLTSVQGGNTAAIPDLIKSGQGFADAALNGARDRAEYLTILATIREGARSAQAVAGDAQDLAAEQLKSLREQVSKLVSLSDGQSTTAQAIKELETATQALGTREALQAELIKLTGKTPSLMELKESFISAERAAAIAEEQLSILQTQVNALLKIDESVLSVAAAIKALEIARSLTAPLNPANPPAAVRSAITTASQGTLKDKVQTLDSLRALGLSDAQIRTSVEATVGAQTDYDFFRLRIAAVADDPTANKVSLYREGIALGFDDAKIRQATESVLGPQTDSDFALLKKLAGFANGGLYPGGLALVGEEGPELINFRQPGQVYTAGQTASILDNTEMVEELRAMREEVALLRAEARATAVASSKTADLLTRATDGGNDYFQTKVAA
jgi:hypothetical protein